jgi:hypothetical protein
MRAAARRSGVLARRYDKPSPAASKHGDIDLKEHHVVDYARLEAFGDRLREDMGEEARRVAFRPLFPDWADVTIGELLNVRQLKEKDIFEPDRAKKAADVLAALRQNRATAPAILTIGAGGGVTRELNVGAHDTRKLPDLELAKQAWEKLTDRGQLGPDDEVDQTLVMDYWVWSHTNLFVGPADRVWDPMASADAFDYYAQYFMSDVRYKRLATLNAEIKKYMALPPHARGTAGAAERLAALKKVLKRIRLIIAKLAGDNKRVEFVPAQWNQVGTKWKPIDAPDHGAPPHD